MTKKIILSPSILSADFLRLGEQVASLEAAGADWVHVDVMDGHFVPNLSMGPVIVEACRRATSLPLDVHLMIANPDSNIEAYARAGAYMITVHAETCLHLHRCIQTIHALGCKAGVALNPATSLDVLDWVVDEVDMLLLLATNPGFSGQQFLPATLIKTAMLAEKLKKAGSSALIQVDGGVNSETIIPLIHNGASVFVAGNAIFKHPHGVKEGINSLRNYNQVR
ncbi:MAG: ribulose-phosphate 3-epimerase [Chloroflexi bacterium HGW-Chloroflexi-10]|nr:MAG: ribulose-phosphate 3-epimerase [Chloroflexi bacterium HGW-Chloroflexi-10]